MEADGGELGGRVVDAAVAAHEPRHAGDGHDVALVGAHHVGQEGLGSLQRVTEISKLIKARRSGEEKKPSVGIRTHDHFKQAVKHSPGLPLNGVSPRPSPAHPLPRGHA